ncbi:Uncharacterised protein [Mycobacteroides abscessus subsp. abscessus]|nr:Uncharacterised protein [Mycobacteroides abscessus subsp. abscessus]
MSTAIEVTQTSGLQDGSPARDSATPRMITAAPSIRDRAMVAGRSSIRVTRSAVHSDSETATWAAE